MILIIAGNHAQFLDYLHREVPMFRAGDFKYVTNLSGYHGHEVRLVGEYWLNPAHDQLEKLGGLIAGRLP